MYKQGDGTANFELNFTVLEAELSFAQEMISDKGKKHRAIVWGNNERKYIIQDTK